MNVASRRARNALYRDFYDLIPLFAAHTPRRPILGKRSPISLARTISSTRCRHLQLESQTPQDSSAVLEAHRHAGRELPRSCPGCGAPTQTIHSGEAGFYSPSRVAVKKYLHPASGRKEDDSIIQSALENVPHDLQRQLGLDGLKSSQNVSNESLPTTPICDRCHNLIHYHSGIPINHPSLDAVEATIAESPHKYNHIYHVIDAADFPMSLVPNLHRRLDLGWLRGRNRRAKDAHWSGGQSGEMSFIITRSDLLAPRKEQVDSLMPQLREILRKSLGKLGEDKRLGNVRLVSSKRGWWTKEIKQAIWERGGGGWLVGKANVGKSNLFEVVFPKGTTDATPKFDQIREEARKEAVQTALQDSLIDNDQIGVTNFHPTQPIEEQPTSADLHLTSQAFDDTSTLLPPAQPETNYPVMPIISSLPGTTASPIRIPFGNGRGELIDLPGLSRPSLDPYINPSHAHSILTKSRITPDRHVLKPGSSLLLGGGLIRITPKTPDTIFLAHAFVPLSTHITATQKAMDLEMGERDLHIPSILRDDLRLGNVVKSAGVFRLDTDVTRKFAGPLTRRDAVGLGTAKLPFVVWATDVLVEGVGWVEVVAQVRKPRRVPAFEIDGGAGWNPIVPREEERGLRRAGRKEKRVSPLEELSEEDLQKTIPEIEVFSPEGRFVGQRPSLSCWLLGGLRDDKKGTGRPRKSMKGVKKLEKRRMREGGE